MPPTDFWAQHGPLGLENYRKQLGRSDEIGEPKPGKRRVILVETGATQKHSGRAQGDAAASAISVTCTYKGVNAANGTRPLQIRGILEWGTDGHQAHAEFDWLNGTVVHVAGSFFRVMAELVDNESTTDEAPTHSDEALANCGAFVAYYPSSRRPPTLTTQIRLLANAAAVVTIPAFARSLTIYGPTLSNADWLLSPTGAIAAIDSPPAPSQSYLRPGPATHVSIASPIAGLQNLVWELCL